MTALTAMATAAGVDDDVHAVVAAAEGPGAGPLRQYLRFALGREMQAVRIEVVREILEFVPLTPLPLMPGFVAGVMNLRGAVVPVIDLGARLGLGTTTPGPRTCVVLVDVRGEDDGAPVQPMGVLVDAVHEVFEARDGEAGPVPRLGTRVASSFLRGMVRARDQVLAELDLDAVLQPSLLRELIARHVR